MRKLEKYFIGLLLCFICSSGMAQKQVPVVTFDWLKNLRNTKSDTTYVVNFFATWCMPCLEELPAFEKLLQATKDQKVKIILVSLDSYRKLDITLKPYLTKEKIRCDVVLLNEPDYNSWIDRVDRSWGGSIPATLIFNTSTKKKIFHEGELSFDQLVQLLQH